LACQRSVPCPSLKTKPSELSTDLRVRVKQLEMLLEANQELVQRCQDTIRWKLDQVAAW